MCYDVVGMHLRVQQFSAVEEYLFFLFKKFEVLVVMGG